MSRRVRSMFESWLHAVFGGVMPTKCLLACGVFEQAHMDGANKEVRERVQADHEEPTFEDRPASTRPDPIEGEEGYGRMRMSRYKAFDSRLSPEEREDILEGKSKPHGWQRAAVGQPGAPRSSAGTTALNASTDFWGGDSSLVHMSMQAWCDSLGIVQRMRDVEARDD